MPPKKVAAAAVAAKPQPRKRKPSPSADSGSEQPKTPPQQEMAAAAAAAERQLDSPSGVLPKPLVAGAAFTAIPALAFVGREEEACTIAEININNKILAASSIREHPTLVSAAQMFGAGKTQMGIQAVARAMRSDVQTRLRTVFRTHDDLVSAYLSSVVITVGLHEGAAFKCVQQHPAAPFPAMLHATVSAEAATRKDSSEAANSWAKEILMSPDWASVSLDFNSICTTFYAVTKRGLFVHWDEVGALEEDEYSSICKPSAADSTLQQQLRRYYSFWKAITDLLRHQHAAVFVTGRRPALALVGRGLLGQGVSPSSIHSLLLRALSADDIQEVINKTLSRDGVHVSQWLKWPNDALRALFIERLLEETAGQPRFVTAYLDAICRFVDGGVRLESPEAIEVAMSEGDKSLRALNIERYTPRHGDDSSVFMHVLLAALLKIPLSLDTETSFAGKQVRLDVIIDKLNVYAERQGKDSALIRVAGCLLRRMHTDSLSGLARVLPAAALLQAPYAMLGAGEPLEWLVRVRIVLYIELACTAATGASRTWADLVTAFKGTMIGPQPVVKVALPLVRAVPKIVQDRRLINNGVPSEEAMAWRSPMHVSHLKAYLASATLLPINTLGVPAPQSHSPDLLLRLHDMLVGFACKLGTTPITWTTLQEEIDKTKTFIDAGCNRVCLVIVALTLGTEVKSVLGKQECLVVGTGMLQELDVPQRMQVVIPSLAGLRSFLGTESINALQKLVQRRRNAPEAPVELSQLLSMTAAAHNLAPAATPVPAAATSTPLLPPFELESFLRDEAKIDADGVEEYMPLLRKNKVNEEVLRELATESKEAIKAELEKWGVSAGGDRTMLAGAIVRRFGGGGG